MFHLKPSHPALDNTDIQFVRYLAALGDADGVAPVFSQEFPVPSAAAILTIEPVQIFRNKGLRCWNELFSSA